MPSRRFFGRALNGGEVSGSRALGGPRAGVCAVRGRRMRGERSHREREYAGGRASSTSDICVNKVRCKPITSLQNSM